MIEAKSADVELFPTYWTVGLIGHCRGRVFIPRIRSSKVSAWSTRWGMTNISLSPLRHLARLAFLAFLLTFVASRTLVILIMTRRMPDLFLHIGGTHVHHLNYGIFLLAIMAGGLLF